MSNLAVERDSNRFTIADYTYDREESTSPVSDPLGAGTSGDKAGMEETGYHASILAPALDSSDAASTFRRMGNPDLQGPPDPWAPRTLVASSSSQLRLHQGSDRPVFHPSTLTTSPTHPLSAHTLSPTSPTAGLEAMPISPTSSDIRPLPSIPRSFSSSSRSMEAGPSTLPRIPPAPHTPPLSHSHDPYDYGRKRDVDLLSPSSTVPRFDHRHSGISSVSNAWTERENEKEKEFPAPPTLTRGKSVTQVVRWYDGFWPSTWACRALLLTIVLETIIDLAIEGNILWRFQSEIDNNDSSQLNFERKRRLPIFLVIYGLAHLWQLVLVVIAIRTRNTIQVVAITAFNFAFLGYAVMQIYELRQILGDNFEDGLTDVDTTESLLTLPLNALTGVVIAVVATGCLILLALSWVLRREFGWQRYRFLGADLQIRKYFTRFQIFECLCYFSAFFCAGFGIQFIWLVLQKTDVEYIITWVAFPLLILLLVLGRWAARYENVYAMGIFMVGLVAGCAYFVFKLVRIWQQEDTTYYRLSKSLTVFDALSLVSLAACFVFGIIVWIDFGKGLKEAVLSQKKASSLHSFSGMWKTRSKSEDDSRQPDVDMAARRISID